MYLFGPMLASFEDKKTDGEKVWWLGQYDALQIALEFGFKDQVINSEGLKNKVLHQSIYALIELGQN